MAEAFLTGQSGKKLVGNAAVGDVLSGKTFSNADSNKLTGTMPNRGKVDYQMPINGSFTIPAGYHNGTGSIFQSITTKGSETFTPGTANQTVASGRYLTGTQTILGDANLVAGNIKNGVSIFGVIGSAAIPGGTAGAAQILAGYTFINSQGVEVTGTIPSKAAATYTPGTSNQTIAIGQYISGTQTITGDADLVTGNIKSGANIFGVAGKASVVDTADATAAAARILSGYTGYVNGVKITGTIPSKAAATYTPGTSAQSISAGQYLSGAQTISAVAGLSAANIKTGATVGGVLGTYKGVGTATAARVLTGYTFSTAALSGASGTMVNRGAITKSLTTQGASYTIPVGYHSGSGKVTASFSNLSAGNIKSGVNIGGVVGELTPVAPISTIPGEYRRDSSRYGIFTSSGEQYEFATQGVSHTITDFLFIITLASGAFSNRFTISVDVGTIYLKLGTSVTNIKAGTPYVMNVLLTEAIIVNPSRCNITITCRIYATGYGLVLSKFTLIT